ncbi:MAG TPA: LamG-like jellyroll fold domain-containing protein [Planctomycetaceae bacterium]
MACWVAAGIGWSNATCRAADEPDEESRAGWRKMAEYGTGFVTWESSRTGRWRIWRRNLDGTNLRQLSPDEKDRNHFCPHVAPDGTRLVFLSCPAGQDVNKGGHALHLISADGSGDRVIIPSARGYGGDRAVIWFDKQRFAYIDGNGITQEFDLESGKNRPVTTTGQKEGGLLVNAARTAITIGYPPTFSIFDSATAHVTPQAALGGCEPYFSHDGRWGFWMGGAGGPINRIELATRQISHILNKDDARMPKARAYLYFPMVSRDGQFLTFAASPNQHDHDKSDYDVFVARLNPQTLEILDRPVRYTFDPATDRYPDVYVAHVEPGRFVGDAPNSVSSRASAINPTKWPSQRDGLVFLFQTADAPNQIAGPDGKPRSYSLSPRGRARWNHDQALVLTGGAFIVDGADEALLSACRKSQRLTLEAVIKPDRLNQTGPARIVTFSSSAGSRNFTLGQEKDKLIFRLRTPNAGENGVAPETQLAAIPTAGEPVHIAVTYRPGQMAAYMNGKEVYRGSNVLGDFSNWSAHHLLFGDEFNGDRDWAGTLEGIAIYDRELEAAEVQRNAAEYQRIIKARKAVPQIEVVAKLLAKSTVPTLDEVKPYRGAMMTCKYEVVQVVRGQLPEKQVLVSHWALLDGEPQEIASLRPGSERRFVLESSELNPQLQRFVCKDNFDSDAELLLPRYYDATP